MTPLLVLTDKQFRDTFDHNDVIFFTNSSLIFSVHDSDGYAKGITIIIRSAAPFIL
jgi:hypothetical protein